MMTATLGYDPLGRLYQTTNGASVTTQLLYDGDELVAEYDGAGSLLRRYVHGAGADDPLVWYEGPTMGASSRQFLHADWQGSIVAISDNAGNPIAVNAYDDYGVPNAGNLGRFQYTGQAWIADLGMYYYKARIYSPTLGRFMQTDPIGYEDQVNLYAYVGSDPVNRADPTGLRRCDGFVDCIVATAETANKNARWAGAEALSKLSAFGMAVTGLYDGYKRERDNLPITVYRVFDNEKAIQGGGSWSIEDPRKMKNWRDRLAVYPAWNKGTFVVEGTITMKDLVDSGNVMPGPGPNSTAGPQPADPAKGGGPYKGDGNELRVKNADTIIKNQRVTRFCPDKKVGC
jgi:RHS repeat-associated protein